LGAALSAGSMLSAPPEPDSGSATPLATTQVSDLNVYTHLAHIPMGYDDASIRFERVKAVKVYTQARYTFDFRYCDQLAAREPGGSMYCPRSEHITPEIAYEITYSYEGRPLTSDEFATQRFTFSVFFRRDDLPAALRERIAARSVKPANLGGFFRVSASHELTSRLVIDDANSKHCELRVDKSGWVLVDRDCVDTLAYKTVSLPSDYITVRVDLN
jgi:hypothetical protein